MFEFDGCIDVTFELAQLVDTIESSIRDYSNIRDSNIASRNAIRDSDVFNKHQFVDCELLALVFNMFEKKRCNNM